MDTLVSIFYNGRANSVSVANKKKETEHARSKADADNEYSDEDYSDDGGFEEETEDTSPSVSSMMAVMNNNRNFMDGCVVGGTCSISWTSTGSVSTVKITYSGSGVTGTVVASTSSSPYSWSVPLTGVPAGNGYTCFYLL